MSIDETGTLVTEGLTKAYGDLVALAPLDLVIGPGERVMLMGHNGSGKTTLLRMASGLLEPSEGTVSIVGAPAGSLDAREPPCRSSATRRCSTTTCRC